MDTIFYGPSAMNAVADWSARYALDARATFVCINGVRGWTPNTTYLAVTDDFGDLVCVRNF